MNALRVAFAGTPEFARVALQQLHQAGFALPLVLTQPDRPAGRGMKLQPSAVKQLAAANAVPVVQPRSLRLDGRFADDADAARRSLLDARPDVLVVAAYGLILPEWVLALPHLGCVNIHASLLPRWRGAAPVQRAIEAGDSRTGITLMQMDAGLDTGDMLRARALDITDDDTAGSLSARLAALGAGMIVDSLHALAGGGLPRTPQPDSGISYAAKIQKSEAAIDWAVPAAVIERRVRAFDPFPGAHFRVDGEPVKLWRCRVVDRHDAEPGELIEASSTALHVACAQQALELVEVQPAGARRMPIAAYRQTRAGAALSSGQRLAGG
jgi:methionyl-tRNA formyltransferase